MPRKKKTTTAKPLAAAPAKPAQPAKIQLTELEAVKGELLGREMMDAQRVLASIAQQAKAHKEAIEERLGISDLRAYKVSKTGEGVLIAQAIRKDG